MKTLSIALFVMASAGFCGCSTTKPPQPVVPPTISVQPQPERQIVVAGSTVNYSVTASGMPAPAYQWRLNSTNLTGATKASLTLTNVQPGNAGNYTVVLNNLAGSVCSDVAVLEIQVPPFITTETNVQFRLKDPEPLVSPNPKEDSKPPKNDQEGQ
jgi:hypothetical protein